MMSGLIVNLERIIHCTYCTVIITAGTLDQLWLLMHPAHFWWPSVQMLVSVPEHKGPGCTGELRLPFSDIRAVWRVPGRTRGRSKGHPRRRAGCSALLQPP